MLPWFSHYVRFWSPTDRTQFAFWQTVFCERPRRLCKFICLVVQYVEPIQPLIWNWLEQEQEMSTTQPGGAGKSQVKRPHIAVLDADQAILDYVHRSLADRFRVSLYTEAAELHRSLGDSAVPDLLLMDWHVTEDETQENAINLLAKIRATKPSL